MSIEDVCSVPGGSLLDADVCIVGAGPAGLTLAAELVGCGAKIILLESGGRESDRETDSLNEIVSVGVPRELDPGLVRNRGLGGTSATWSGRLATLDPIDFAARPWVPESGWPVSRAELQPYYARAAVHLGSVVADSCDPEVLERIARRMPQTDPELLVPYVWAYSRQDAARRDFMRFGNAARESGLPGIACFLHATVTQIETNEAGSALDRLEVTGRDGQVRWLRSRRVVLCAGAIENARLLLASNRVNPSGVGNQSGLVGSFLMDHLRGPVAEFAPHQWLDAQRVFGDFLLKAAALPASVSAAGATGTGRMTPGYALSPSIQESEGLLNCAVFIAGRPAEDDPLDSALRLAGGQNPLTNLRNVLRHPVVAAQALERPLRRGRFPLSIVSELHLLCITEQRPDPASRITLADRRDALGAPLARIDWRVGEQEASTVRRTTRLFVEQMQRMGCPAPVPTQMITDETAEFFLPDVAHPSGTTRMSEDASRGVVDPNCAVHGVKGLYALGGSVFPTNGHANPTQTIVALAVRLADYFRSVPEAPGTRGAGTTTAIPDAVTVLGGEPS